MKNYYLILAAGALLLMPPAQAQIKIGGAGTPNASAVLELESTNQGFLPPRLSTAQRDAISTPTNGMVIYNTTLGCLQLYNSGSWICLGNSTPRLTNEQIEALPSPQPGDVAFDLTFGCLRYYFNSRWVCSARNANDPTPDVIAWRAGGTNIDEGYGVAVDGSGNVYVTGVFAGTASFGATTLISEGGYDVFVAKYNSSGVPQWAQRAGGTNHDFGNGMSVDGSGNVYITGTFRSTASFGATTLISAGVEDMFLAKYSNGGVVLWAQRAGGTSDDYGISVAIDGTGDVYVAGTFQGNASFGATTLISAGSYDIFVAKYSGGGVLQWAQRAGGTGFDVGRFVTVTGSGNVYVTGYFGGTAGFGATNLISVGGFDIFLVKYDELSNIQWAQRAGGANDDYGESVAVDNLGRIYVSGYFFGTASFGATTLNSAGLSDVYLAQYNSGGVLQWAQRAGGTGYDYGSGVSMDGSGNAYIAGTFQGTATFGGITLTSAGNDDLFVAKYSSSGLVQWAQRAGGASSEKGRGVAVDGSGNVYTTGYFQGIATFGSTTLTSAGSYDMFVARFKE